MRRSVLLGAVALAAGIGFVAWRLSDKLSNELVSVPAVKPPEAAPLCPWREPQSDLQAFFPDATRYSTETRILSGGRLELAQRLGRAPTGDENALRFYQVYRQEQPLGDVLTRRVKGEYGAIELVLATDTNGAVRGLRLQRLREPGPVSAALEDPNWRASFVGKHAGDSWKLGGDVSDVPAAARGSAAAIVEGVRSSLVLLSAAERTESPSLAQAHHE